jgi:hypothetical protein
MTVTNAIMCQQYVLQAAAATNNVHKVNPLSPKLNPICYLLAQFSPRYQDKG